MLALCVYMGVRVLFCQFFHLCVSSRQFLMGYTHDSPDPWQLADQTQQSMDSINLWELKEHCGSQTLGFYAKKKHVSNRTDWWWERHPSNNESSLVSPRPTLSWLFGIEGGWQVYIGDAFWKFFHQWHNGIPRKSSTVQPAEETLVQDNDLFPSPGCCLVAIPDF